MTERVDTLKGEGGKPQETALANAQKAIVMKSGLVQWVDLDTAARVENHLASQQGHSFIRLKEYDVTINSAEIDGVYTPEQYADIQKAKNGYWQCELKGWHAKREKCECREEAARKRRQADQDKRYAEMNRQQSPEEQARSRERMRTMTEESALKGSSIFVGMFSKGGTRRMRRSTIVRWEEENGPVDPAILSKIAIEEDIETAREKEVAETF